MAAKTKTVGKSLKMPFAWDQELTRIRGSEMAKTGVEVSTTTMILRALDKMYNLSEATGVKIDDHDSRSDN